MRAVSKILAAGALILGAGPLRAANCDANHLFTYDFGAAAAQQLSYATSYSWTGTNPLGGSQAVGVAFQTFGTASTVVGGMQMPRIDPSINDGNPATANNLMIGMTLAARTADITVNTNVVVTTFTFTAPVRDFTIQVNDVDFATNQYRDWLQITGSDGTNTYNPALITPFGQNNSGGPTTATGSTVQLGASSTPLTVAVNQGIGNATNPNTQNGGTITASFVQPVKSIQLRYGNSNQSPGGTTTGQQAFGVQKLTWCAMPQLAVSKTSTPLATSGNNSFNIPGADLVYSITMANNGGSNIDLATLTAIDTMPAATSFFNGNFSGTVTGPFQVVTAGGATVTAQSFAYSSDGSTFAYAPAAGYDPAVKAFRFNGLGSVPPGGSVVLNFRAQIK